jgi:glutamine amidotransferase
MGWNRVEPAKQDPLISTLPDKPRFYFVHSYYVRCADRSDVLLSCTHGERFAAGFQRENIRGVQFHPEKSHRHGLALMQQFASL